MVTGYRYYTTYELHRYKNVIRYVTSAAKKSLWHTKEWYNTWTWALIWDELHHLVKRKTRHTPLLKTRVKLVYIKSAPRPMVKHSPLGGPNIATSQNRNLSAHIWDIILFTRQALGLDNFSRQINHIVVWKRYSLGKSCTDTLLSIFALQTTWGVALDIMPPEQNGPPTFSSQVKK